jgi:hypothetical protein
VSNRPHTQIKPPKRTARADRESAFTQAFNDLLAAARCEGQRAAYSHALDLAKFAPQSCAAEIESVMHELPR